MCSQVLIRAMFKTLPPLSGLRIGGSSAIMQLRMALYRLTLVHECL